MMAPRPHRKMSIFIAILAHLKARGTQTVGDIAEAIQLSIRTTSKHLQILRSVRVVIDRRRGMSVSYRLSSEQDDILKPLLIPLRVQNVMNAL